MPRTEPRGGQILDGSLTDADFTGQLTVAKGGTGAASHTSGGLLVGAGTSPTTVIAPGGANTVLASNGTVWSAANISAAMFAGSAIVTESEGVNSSDNDTSFPTTAAVKDYVDTTTPPVMAVTAVKTANYTAASAEIVPVDATSGAIIITLPTAPANGTRVMVKRNDAVVANTITVTCGGSDRFNHAAGGTTQTLPFQNYGLWIEYNSGVWYQLSTALPIGQLDARYVGVGARINPRIGTATSSSTPTPSADSHDQYNLTAQTTGMTWGAPTGTAVDGQKMMLRIKTASAQSIAFNSIYRAMGITAPTTTAAGKTTYIGIIYNAADTKWDIIAAGTEA